jgi:proteic killer suppression protein
MIKSFRDRHTEAVFLRSSVKRFGHEVQRLALRKLLQIDAATQLETLRIPPESMLKPLRTITRDESHA